MVTEEMIDWYYRTNNNQVISAYDLEHRESTIMIVEENKFKTFTIGNLIKRCIEIKFNFYKGEY